MLQHSQNPTTVGRPARRRGRLIPVRRILTTGLCAGAALLSSAAAQAQQPITPVGYNTGLRGHSTHVGHGHSYYNAQCCPPYAYPGTPYYHSHQPYADQTPTPADRSPDQDAQAPSTQDLTPAPDTTQAPFPSTPSLSGATGTATAPSSAVPNAIGDFFTVFAGRHGQEIFYYDNYTIGQPYIALSNPATSVVGRIKASENNSPMPTDRVFLDFAVYNNVPFTTPDGRIDGIDVQRFIPGIERTLFDGMMSVELRMPFARTLDNAVVFGEGLDGDSWEIGNLYAAVKTLLYQGDTVAVTGGLGINVPTAEDLKFTDSLGGTGEIENEAVHLLPFFGLLHTPNDTFYTQTYVQVDVDANGNTFRWNGLDRGVIQDQTLLYADVVVGAWLYDDPSSNGIQGIVGTTEIHYTTSVKDFDAFNDVNTSTDPVALDDFDFLTGIVGIHLLHANGAQLTFAYGVPLITHRFSDGEFRMMVNWGLPAGGFGGR